MAKKFSFNLEPVLRLRSHKVKLAEEELMQVLSARIKKESKIAELDLYYKSLLNVKKRACSAGEIQAECRHKEYIKEEISRLIKEKEQLIEIEAIKRKKLTEAMKGEKALEKLKERKLEDYKLEMNREETKEFNEIASSRHSKKIETESL